MNETSYNIFDLGFNKLLTRDDSELADQNDLGLASFLKSDYYQVPPSNIASGEATGNLTFADGFIQSVNYITGVSGWKIDALGNAEFNAGIFRGNLIAGSIDIPNKTTANSFHVDADGNAWWGATLIASAVAKILKTGAATFSSVTISGGSLVTFISDTIDTSSKFILKDFTFGSADYAGAFKSGDITWNASTGAVTGGSGILMYKKGIVGAAGGVVTFSIDATTGSATFLGQVSATSGYFGDLTNGISVAANGLLINGSGYVRTAASGTRIELVKSITGGYTDGLISYYGNDVQFRLFAGGGYPNLTMFCLNQPNAQFLSSATNGPYNVKIEAKGVDDGLLIETSGSTARSAFAGLKISQASTYGFGINITKGSGALDAGIYVMPYGSSKYGNLFLKGNPGSGWVATLREARITDEGYIQFPQYHHRSDFDEGTGAALASTVIANAYWTGGGTGGTQTLLAGTNEDQSSCVKLSTTNTANRSSSIAFKRVFGVQQRCVEFRVAFNSHTNTSWHVGFYSGTYYSWFNFDTAVDSTKVYAECYAGSLTRVDTGRQYPTDTTGNGSTWLTLRIQEYFNDTNFYIDDVLVAHITTNTYYNPMYPYCYINNKAASEEKKMFVDYCMIWKGRDGTGVE